MNDEKHYEQNEQRVEGAEPGVRRARRRDALNELIDNCNAIINSKTARPADVVKAIATKAETVFRQQDSKTAELTKEAAELRKQVEALTTELNGTEDTPGARKKAAEYDALVPLHKGLKEEAEKDASKYSNEKSELETRVNDLSAFLTWYTAAANPKSSKQVALRFFLKVVPDSMSGKNEILQAFGISETEVARWHVLRRSWSGGDLKLKLVEAYAKETAEDVRWFLKNRLLIEFNIDADAAVKQVRKLEQKNQELQERLQGIKQQERDEDAEARRIEGAREAEIEAVHAAKRPTANRVEVPDYGIPEIQ